MNYLLKHKDNKTDYGDSVCLLDCPVTLLNHFETGLNVGNSYIIDTNLFEGTNMIIIKSIIKQINKNFPVKFP